MTEQSKKDINRFKILLSIIMFVTSIMIYWVGINFLRDQVFSNYFNPKKHLIVTQNSDTKEIYAWKDARGTTYTMEDADVRNFTWGTTALLLFVMIFVAVVYNASVDYYTKTVIKNEIRQKHLLPGMHWR